MSFSESFTVQFGILLLTALLISSIGFYKYVYFISLGYGYSIAALGSAMLILFHRTMSMGMLIPCALFIIYGLRLGTYLLVREIKSAPYRATMKKEIKDGTDMKMIAKLSIWISCAFLYVCQVSPVFFHLQNEKAFGTCGVIGTVIMLAGIGLESVADLQKSSAKRKNPSRFCDSGVYKIVRCPNYLGEILFWTGVFVQGVTALNGVWQWAATLIGYLGIVYIMFGGARRLELRQNRNYGENKDYQSYVKKTPIILPFIPLYSVAKHKWLLG